MEGKEVLISAPHCEAGRTGRIIEVEPHLNMGGFSYKVKFTSSFQTAWFHVGEFDLIEETPPNSLLMLNEFLGTA